LQKIAVVTVLFGLVITPAFPTQGRENERTIHEVNTGMEDKSCSEVNRAYDSMNNSGRWSTDVFWLYPNGNTELYLHTVFFDRRRFEQRDGSMWSNHERLPLRLRNDSISRKPIFTACQSHGVQTVRGESALFFTADWQKENVTASIEIWISTSSGKFVKTVLHYQPKLTWSDVSDVVQTMDFDRSTLVEPWNIAP
jgi:hypothetical protein